MGEEGMVGATKVLLVTKRQAAVVDFHHCQNAGTPGCLKVATFHQGGPLSAGQIYGGPAGVPFEGCSGVCPGQRLHQACEHLSRGSWGMRLAVVLAYITLSLR